jgi:uncharacterized protein (TIGR03083 family)
VPARRIDPSKTAAAVTEQAAAIGNWLPSLDEGDWAAATPLPDWSVAHLVLHLAQTLRTITATLSQLTDEAPGSLSEYFAKLPAAAEQIRDRELAAARDASPTDSMATYSDELRLAAGALEQVRGAEIVRAPRGPLRIGDFLGSRAVELTVHADDLGRALPARRQPPVRRPALAATCRLLADVLATTAPGRSVEVRIPPYAAVQCVPGPRHTRGTPPTVIETDPVTWIRLGTGRIGWDEALDRGRVNASGERSDLSRYLPLVS